MSFEIGSDVPRMGNVSDEMKKKILVARLIKNPYFRQEFVPEFFAMSLEEQYMLIEYLFNSSAPREYCPSCYFKTRQVDFGDHEHRYWATDKPAKKLVVDAIKRQLNDDPIGNYHVPTLDLPTVTESIETTVLDRSGTELVVQLEVATVIPPLKQKENVLPQKSVQMIEFGMSGDLSQQADAIVENVLENLEVPEFSTVAVDVNDCLRNVIVPSTAPDPSTEEFITCGWVENLITYDLKKVGPFNSFTIFNFRSILDWNRYISRRQIGTGEDVWEYSYRTMAWTIDFDLPISAFAIGVEIIQLLKRDVSLPVTVFEYDPDYLDFTLILLVLYDVNSYGRFLLKDNYPSVGFMPGIDRVFTVKFLKQIQYVVAQLKLERHGLTDFYEKPSFDTFSRAVRYALPDRPIMLSVLEKLKVNRGWMRRRLLMHVEREYVIPKYVQRWCYTTIGRMSPVVVDVHHPVQVGIKLLMDRIYNEIPRSWLNTSEIIYYPRDLINYVSRDIVTQCIHSGVYHLFDKLDLAYRDIKFFSVYRVIDNNEDPLKWYLVLDTTLNGISLPIVGGNGLEKYPLILCVCRDSLKNAMYSLNNYPYYEGLWSLCEKFRGVSNHLADDYDNYDFYLRSCYYYNKNKKNLGKVGVFKSVSVEDVLFVLKSYDFKNWRVREKLRACLNVIPRYLNSKERVPSVD